MEKRTYDKSTWGKGPWMTEPDRVEFEHCGLPCLMLRNDSGVWCGYAAVPPGHPYHGHSYHDVPVDVHGGLTYRGACQGAICHVPKPGEPDDVFWFGFDCAHYNDIVPSHHYIGISGLAPGSVYRDMAYVRAEVERLAEQLQALTKETR